MFVWRQNGWDGSLQVCGLKVEGGTMNEVGVIYVVIRTIKSLPELRVKRKVLFNEMLMLLMFLW